MKIVFLTPGTGNFYCGSCLRDNALVKELRARGHDAILAPLYLPLVTDDAPANPELSVFTGGINMFLQHKLGLFRALPRWTTACLDNEALLRKASEFMGMTRIRDLGTMTIDSYRGLAGNQAKEWRILLAWLRDQKPDVVALSNGLLCGVAKGIQEQVGAKVVANLQGEDSFIETLPEPYQSESWAAFRGCVPFVDQFVGVSEFYSARMAAELALGKGQITTVLNGVDAERFVPGEKRENAIGFLARLCKGKGLELLVDAFIALRSGGACSDWKLKLAGTETRADLKFIAMQKEKVAKAGLGDAVVWLPNLTLEEKVAFLQSLSVFSVPATYGEAFGFYLLEAWACGVPVVQPKIGAFPELVKRTGGGVLCEPDDVDALASALSTMIEDKALREEQGRAGRRAVEESMTTGDMADALLAVCDSVVNR